MSEQTERISELEAEVKKLIGRIGEAIQVLETGEDREVAIDLLWPTHDVAALAEGTKNE